MTGLPNGDPLAQLALNMGNSQTAGQMLPGLPPGPAVEGLGPAHGCEVICMASHSWRRRRHTEPDLLPWMQPMTPPPWMAPGSAPRRRPG